MSKSIKWSFDDESIDFDDHVKTSIPFYEETHKLISFLSTFFIKDNGLVYEVGCSTGTLLSRINEYNQNDKVNYIGIEPSKKLYDIAKKKYNFKNLKFTNTTVQKHNFLEADLIISHFMLQFVNFDEWDQILEKLYNSLRVGGGFIFFEKNFFDNVQMDHIMSSVYNYDFKKSNRYSIKEIYDKSYSLRGVMKIQSESDTLKMLYKAKFKNVSCVFKWGQFTGFLCIK